MELLITVVSLAVAIYAVTPRERQLNLLLKLGAFGWFWVLAILLFLCTLYLSYYEFFETHGLAQPSCAWPTGVTPAKCVPMILLVGLGILWIRLKYTRLSRGHIRRFHTLAEEMVWSGAHVELLALLQSYVNELFSIAHADFPLARLRSRIESQVSPSFEDLTLSLSPKVEAPRPGRVREAKNKPLNFLFRRLGKPLLKVLPTYDAEAQDASQIIRTVLLNQPFVASLTRYRPYLGVTILDVWTMKYDREEFLKLYISELMSNETSIIYSEIAANLNQMHGHRYDLPPTNRLLRFFFADARIAQLLEVYRPVGEFVLRELDRLARDPAADPYNEAMDDFEEAGRWRSPVYVGLRFFDIMVTEALFQGIEWHMWLYYLTHMTDKIVQNYKGSELEASDKTTYPTKYSRLLYEIFSIMRDWIVAADEVPENQNNVRLQNSRADNENNNIIKSSVLALGHCAATVLTASQVGDALKNSLINMSFELYFTLRRSEKRRAYADALTESLQNGGTVYRSSRRDYREALATYFHRNMHEYLITHLRDDVLALERAVG